MENKNIYRFEIRTMADGRVNRVMYQENPTVGNFWTLFPGGIYKKCEDPKVEETCAAVAAAAARGDEAAKKAAKDTLPAFIFGAQMVVDATRKKSIPSGLHCVDFDHIQNPHQIYKERIERRVAELGIYLVAISPSGQGLKIVFERRRGTKIADDHARIAEAIGLSCDTKCADLGRCCYVFPPKNILYFNESGFWFKNKEEAIEVAEHFGAIDYPSQSVNGAITPTHTPIYNNVSPAGQNGVVLSVTPPKDEVNSFKISEIVNAVLQVDRQLNPTKNNDVVVGQRHNDYFAVAHFMAKFDAGCSAYSLFQMLPDLGLGEKERQDICRDVMGYSYPKGFRLILKKLDETRKMAAIEQGGMAETTVAAAPPSGAPLPELFQILTSRLPDFFCTPTVCALLPIIGTYMTNVRFTYLSRKHSLSFLSFLSGTQSSGKGEVYTAMALARSVLKSQDDATKKEWANYKRRLKYRKEGEPLPDEPTAYYRLAGTSNSSGQIMKLLDKAGGQHLLTIDEEIGDHFKNAAKEFAASGELYKKAFDNGEVSSSYMSEDSFSGMVDVYYNVSFLGQPEFRENFRQNITDGLTSRWLFPSLPDRFGEKAPEYQEFTPEQKMQVEDITRRLMAEGGYKNYPQINQAAIDWVNEKAEEALATGSVAIDTLRKRNGGMFVRVAYMFAILFELDTSKPASLDEEHIQYAIDWGRHIAEYNLRQQLNFYGDDFDKSCGEVIVKKYRRNDILKQLPAVFCREDLEKICQKENAYTGKNAYKLIRDWLNANIIAKEKDTYRKL